MMIPQRERGFSLVEVIIAILLTAIVVASVMAVVLTIRRDAPRADRKMIASQAAKQLMDHLDNYVTADFGAGQGPNAGNWSFPGEDGNASNLGCYRKFDEPPPAWCNGNRPSCGAAAYALQTDCIHNATSFLSQEMKIASIGMTMCYCVGDMFAPGQKHNGVVAADLSSFVPRVYVAVDWREQQI